MMLFFSASRIKSNKWVIKKPPKSSYWKTSGSWQRLITRVKSFLKRHGWDSAITCMTCSKCSHIDYIFLMAKIVRRNIWYAVCCGNKSIMVKVLKSSFQEMWCKWKSMFPAIIVAFHDILISRQLSPHHILTIQIRAISQRSCVISIGWHNTYNLDLISHADLWSCQTAPQQKYVCDIFKTVSIY